MGGHEPNTGRNPAKINQCLPSEPACIYAEKLFVDGIEYKQVVAISELEPGAFYFDYANDKIYLSEDPTSKYVEVTTGSGGLVGFSDADSVVVRNLVFEKFGGAIIAGESRNSIKAKSGWLVANNTFRYNSNKGVTNYGGIVRNNHIHNNGRVGIVGSNLIEGNLIEHNNTDGFDPNNDAGGSKFFRTLSLKLRGNYVRYNNGNGLWADADNKATLYENNILESNQGFGIYHEVGCNSLISNNVFQNNNKANAGKSLWHGAQLYIRTSMDMEIEKNLFIAGEESLHAIGLRGGDSQSYSYPNCGNIQMRDYRVHHNWVNFTEGALVGFVGADTSNLNFFSNTYFFSDNLGRFFNNGGIGPIDFKAWQAAGYDLDSKFITTATSGYLSPPVSPQNFKAF